jgi:hypothetical protein
MSTPLLIGPLTFLTYEKAIAGTHLQGFYRTVTYSACEVRKQPMLVLRA